MENTFQVRVQKENWDKSSVELSVTHNGYHFSSIGSLKADEIDIVIKALQEYKRSNKGGLFDGCVVLPAVESGPAQDTSDGAYTCPLCGLPTTAGKPVHLFCG